MQELALTTCKIVYDTELDDYINCFFYILAERVDVEKLQVEIDG